MWGSSSGAPLSSVVSSRRPVGLTSVRRSASEAMLPAGAGAAMMARSNSWPTVWGRGRVPWVMATRATITATFEVANPVGVGLTAGTVAVIVAVAGPAVTVPR